MDQVDIKILNYLQEGITLSPRPFLDMAWELGNVRKQYWPALKPCATGVLSAAWAGYFDLAPCMGMKSTLCARRSWKPGFRRWRSRLMPAREVTHNYLRNDVYIIMWFTVTASSGK